MLNGRAVEQQKQRLTTLARARHFLATHGVEALDASTDAGAFGSWYVTARTEPPIRIIWDGKDHRFGIERWTPRVFNGLAVWEDLWTGPMEAQEDPEPALMKLLAFVKSPAGQGQQESQS